jgi:DNA-binding transcriptional MerR regulator
VRISELSDETGVPIPTIKFYLREGLLPLGHRLVANRADYDDNHARRLRLIRALVDVGGLPLATVREILRALDDPGLPMHRALGAAHRALGPEPAGRNHPRVVEARSEVDRFLDRLGWDVSAESPGRHELAVALATLRGLGWPNADARLFSRYAKAANRLAALEVARATPSGVTGAEAMERVVIETVVFDAVFSALRRLAHERHSAARLTSKAKL